MRPVDGFEHDLAAVLASSGLPHATNVQPGPAGPRSTIGVALRREIDAVVAVPANGELWVIEAKDLAVPFSGRRIRSELDKYHRSRGHLAKLAEKVGDVQFDVDRAVARIGAPPRPYQVHGLFVTREPSPAGCFDEVRYPFLLLDQLTSWLTQSRTYTSAHP